MWQPITNAERSQRCWDTIEAIASSLLGLGAPDARPTHPSLLASGQVGLALFFAYLDAARPDSGSSELAFDLLGQGIDALSKVTLYPDLYSGFCGTGWVLKHLTPWLFEANDDLTADIDATLRELLHKPESRPYELMSGLAGLGIYLLERLPHADAGDLVSRILDRLEETAEESAAGCTWHTPPEWLSPQLRLQFPEGAYNLGVSHGVPGVIGFLAAAQRAGISDPRISELADGAVLWLLSQRLPEGGDSFFPALVAPGIPSGPTRSGWCYGDPGVAAVLLSAARSFGREDWEREALGIVRLLAKRPVEVMEATDACLCHGTAGLAHVFNRIHQATGDLEMREAALVWLERTLALRRSGQGLAGFVNWIPDERGVIAWRAEPGFLSGVAGIGLALLAAVTDVEPAWDRVMLLSIPAAARGVCRTEVMHVGTHRRP